MLRTFCQLARYPLASLSRPARQEPTNQNLTPQKLTLSRCRPPPTLESHSRYIQVSHWLFSDREISKVKKLDDKLLELKEEDLVEYHVKGRGAGGQKVNKTANCVILRHNPTGVSVRVHESRSLLDNMEIARARLRMKVDMHIRGEESVLIQEKKTKILKNQHSKSSARKNLEGKAKLKKVLETEDDVAY